MQTSCSPHQLVAGTQVKMVGICQQNLDTGFQQIARRYGFYRCLRTDGHKDRRFDFTMIGYYSPGAGAARLVSMFQQEKRLQGSTQCQRSPNQLKSLTNTRHFYQL